MNKWLKHFCRLCKITLFCRLYNMEKCKATTTFGNCKRIVLFLRWKNPHNVEIRVTLESQVMAVVENVEPYLPLMLNCSFNKQLF